MTRAERTRRFEELVRRHRGEVYRAVLRGTGSREEAEDITQTAMLHAYRAWERGDLPEHPRAWMFAIAENARRGVYRRSRRRPEEVELPEEVVDDRTSDAPLARELLDAVSTLPDRQRAVLVLREVAGLSYTEIADQLGESVGAVQMLLFRARRALRAELQPQRRVLERLAFLPPGWLHVFQPGGGGSLVARATGGAGALALGLLVAGSVPTGDAAPRDAERPVAVVRAAGAPQESTFAVRTPFVSAPRSGAGASVLDTRAASVAGGRVAPEPAGGSSQPETEAVPDDSVADGPSEAGPSAPAPRTPAPPSDETAAPKIGVDPGATVTTVVDAVTDAVAGVVDVVADATPPELALPPAPELPPVAVPALPPPPAPAVTVTVPLP